jgi:hypothetical protein
MLLNIFSAFLENDHLITESHQVQKCTWWSKERGGGLVLGDLSTLSQPKGQPSQAYLIHCNLPILAVIFAAMAELGI